MPFARFLLTRSVGGAVVVTLVCVNTLLLTVFGILDYHGEKRRLETELRGDISLAADQFAENLSQSLWYLEKDQVIRLIDGLMQNEIIAAVVVTEQGEDKPYVGRVRDRAWRASPLAERPAMDDVIAEKRDVRFDNTPVGSVEIFGSSRFLERDLETSLARIVLRILGLNAALALCVALIVRWRVIAPLARLEGYAARVNLGADTAGDPETDGQLDALRFELGSLGRTMRETVRRLSAAERKYRDIFEHATEGIFQTTLDGRMLSANAALARMLGYGSPEELVATFVDVGVQLYHTPEDRRAMLARLLVEESIAGLQVRFKRRDGQTIWVLLNVRLVRDDAGLPLYTEGTLTDVTARVRAERRLEILNRHLSEAVRERTRRLAEKAAELEAANERLKELDRLKSGFLATVSHDLRTPLTSIMGFAKLIARDFAKFFAPFAAGHQRLTGQAERLVANLNIIESEGERLTRLINDFLDLSKIESGQAQWRDTVVDAAVLIGRAAASVSADFEAKPEVAFAMEVADDLPPLYIDPDRLTQVLVNLLGNAAKFTDEGRVRLRAGLSEGFLRVEVSDTGQGVPRESLEKIFDKFHQAQAGDTVADGQRPKGTGLGLAICRQIVEHYKGRIWAESELGRGSTFILELPLSQAVDAAQPVR
ncbi:MAG: PAS domain-containing sensor histidine kinase [Solidesulfovibrio sp.]|uniref:sensor histidine kinase n=1 Tax=Solidesulfovibrio sp. TaxID=2910990 RepID=UPI002B21A6FA|nr:PAS domain-containing sensor histidine kinase [Solidesulfovibrio sp.]MEA4858524.1 PAS domain-containing sensor histidine kinase [Solidesulfovibrio sp.]